MQPESGKKCYRAHLELEEVTYRALAKTRKLTFATLSLPEGTSSPRLTSFGNGYFIPRSSPTNIFETILSAILTGAYDSPEQGFRTRHRLGVHLCWQLAITLFWAVIKMNVHWYQVKRQIKKDDAGKHDIVVDPRSIRWLIPDGKFSLEADGAGPFSLSEWAECQLCGRLGIPVKYFRTCPGKLKKMQVEYLIKHKFEKGKHWRLRLKGNSIRGLVSGVYQPFDNNKVVTAWENIGQCDRFRYESLLDDTSLFLRAIVPNGEDGNDELGGLLTGFYIRNSEVGRSAI